jgi:hypothetical protein|uniref:hypothetical protein n=1 Tax=Prosthecobacter sp. TaxID=1965333 RepID=UPI0037844550
MRSANWMLCILALLLALPVGLEACSVPGAVSEKDQPHALVSDGDDQASFAQALDPHVMDADWADFPALLSTLLVPSAGTRLDVAAPLQSSVGVRLHRRLCRELC